MKDTTGKGYDANVMHIADRIANFSEDLDPIVAADIIQRELWEPMVEQRAIIADLRKRLEREIDCTIRLQREVNRLTGHKCSASLP